MLSLAEARALVLGEADPVESVEVSLNKGLATVKLKPGNTGSVTQLWELIHKNGYTPKITAVSVRGDLENANGRLQLKVSGTKETPFSSNSSPKTSPNAAPWSSNCARPRRWKPWAASPVALPTTSTTC